MNLRRSDNTAVVNSTSCLEAHSLADAAERTRTSAIEFASRTVNRIVGDIGQPLGDWTAAEEEASDVIEAPEVDADNHGMQFELRTMSVHVSQ